MTNIKTLDPTYRLRKGDAVLLRAVLTADVEDVQSPPHERFCTVDGMGDHWHIVDITKAIGLLSYSFKVGERVIVGEDSEYPATIRAICGEYAWIEWMAPPRRIAAERLRTVRLSDLARCETPPEPPIDDAAVQQLLKRSLDTPVDPSDRTTFPLLNDPLINRKVAADEGWGLFESGDGTLVIEQDNEANVFADGLAAYAFVEKKAAEGSEYHKNALEQHGKPAPSASQGEQVSEIEEEIKF